MPDLSTYHWYIKWELDTRTPQEQEMVKREIEPAADGRIDRLVYELPQGG